MRVKSNILVLDNNKFVYDYISVQFQWRKIFLSGLFYKSIDNKFYDIYYDTLFSLEVNLYYAIYFWILSKFNRNVFAEKIENFIHKYKNSNVIHISLDNVRTGFKLGKLEIKESNMESLDITSLLEMAKEILINKSKDKQIIRVYSSFKNNTCTKLKYTRAF